MPALISSQIKTTLTCVAFLAMGWVACAQTNPPALFQGYGLGATVRVRAEKPLILLNHATLKEITASNLVVVAGDDRYVLSRTNTVLTDPAGAPAAGAASARPVAPAASASLAAPALPQLDINSLMAGIQQSVLGQYARDPGHGKAVEKYQSTVAAFLSGKQSLADIAGEAEKLLAEVDKYQPERAKDPQYENQIATLRAFILRVRAGEKLEPPRPE